MHAGDGPASGVVPERAHRTPPWSGRSRHQLAANSQRPRPARQAVRGAGVALAWTASAAALFFLALKISMYAAVSSDAANNALQSWDMLHGHLMMHGWLLGDVTFYTFELPVFAVAEALFGLQAISVHVAVALTYLIVAALAVAIAVTGSRGTSRAVRGLVMAAVLSAPLLIASDRWITLGMPDHFGTVVFLLAPCLLIDRAPGWRFTAPLLCGILAAGQVGDATVRYVIVPAIVVSCAYRALATRKLAGCDSVNLIAAAASVPLALAVHAVMRHYGSYLMVSPRTSIAPVSAWGHNWALAWHSLRLLFGAQGAPAQPAGSQVIFGYACLAVAAAGAVRVLCRWRTARRSEQVLLAAIVVNILAYAFSTVPANNNPHEIVAVLAAGAILGARALVPARIEGRFRTAAAVSAALTAALVPASWVAAQPSQVPKRAPLASWLQADGLRYGLGGYWNGSSVTLLTRNQVQVRAVAVRGGKMTLWPWETNTLWFDPSRNYANFVIVGTDVGDVRPEAAQRFFGKPARIHQAGIWQVFIYDKNLLNLLQPAKLPPVS